MVRNTVAAQLIHDIKHLTQSRRANRFTLGIGSACGDAAMRNILVTILDI